MAHRSVIDGLGKTVLRLCEIAVLKFGVGISNDVCRLATGFQVVTEGAIDLRNLAIRCGIRHNCSLGGLTSQIVGRDLVKTRDITCSNWEQVSLTPQQVHYAAADAITALLILSALVDRKLSHKRGHWGDEAHDPLHSDRVVDRTSQLDTPTPASLSLLLQDEAIKCAHSLCQGLVGIEFKQLSKGNVPLSDDNSCANQTAKRTSAYNVRKTPLYHNCQLIGPDGTLLATVDQKKIDWYISKGLGELVYEDPPTVQLCFEPSGKPNEYREYYLMDKENVCVVCGRDDSYIRKNIIPHEYRKHFPKIMKEHISHDVLLMCVSCHQLSDKYDRFMRREVALEYEVPVDAGTQKYREDPEKVKKRSLARALIGRKGIPEKRRAEIFETLTSLLECTVDDITNELLEQLANMETRELNDGFVSHGELVVQAVVERGELLQFQRKWRIHFIDSMKPRFLPELWSVDHNPHGHAL